LLRDRWGNNAAVLGSLLLGRGNASLLLLLLLLLLLQCLLLLLQCLLLLLQRLLLLLLLLLLQRLLLSLLRWNPAENWGSTTLWLVRRRRLVCKSSQMDSLRGVLLLLLLSHIL